jgi:hypothetical protein
MSRECTTTVTGLDALATQPGGRSSVSPAARAEPVGTAPRVRELLDGLEIDCGNRDHHELCDSIPTIQVYDVATMVDQDGVDFSAESGVNHTRSVDDGDCVARSEAGPGGNETHVAIRDRNGDTGRNHRPLSRFECHGGPGVEIDSGVSRMSSLRRR